MKTDLLKKSAAVAVTAAMLLTGPGLPMAQAAGDILSGPVGEARVSASPSAPGMAGAAGISSDSPYAAEQRAKIVGTGLIVADDAEAAVAAALADPQSEAAAEKAAEKLSRLVLASHLIGSDPKLQMEAAELQARYEAARDRFPLAMRERVANRMVEMAQALNTARAEESSAADGVAAGKAPVARKSGLSRATKRVGALAGLAAGALALHANDALARSWDADRYAQPEPSTFDWIMGMAQQYAVYPAMGLAAAGLAVIGRSMFFTVPQGHIYITNFLGYHSKSKEPGLKTKAPFFQTIRQDLSLQNQTETLKFRAITKDQASVMLDATLTYAVLNHDPETLKKAAYTFRSQGEFMTALKSSVEGTIRSFIAEKEQSQVNGLRSEIFEEVQKHLEKTVAGWGYKIVNVQVNEVSFDPEIKASMDEIVNSQNKLKAAEQQAEALFTQITTDAAGEGKAMVTRATAEADALISEGEGVGLFRDEAMRGVKAATDTGLSSTFLAFMMQLDTLRKVARDSKGNALIINGSPSGMEATIAKIQEMLAKGAAQASGEQAKDKAGSAVANNPNSGISGLWLLGGAAALMGFASMGLGVLPWVGGALAAVILAKSVFFVVPHGYVDVVEQFTQFHSVKEAGWNVKVPFIQKIKRRISLQYRTQQYNQSKATTSDQANITFNATLIYKVKDDKPETIKTVAYQYIDEESFQKQLQSSVENSIRAIVFKKKQAEILGMRQDLAEQARVHLGEELSGYGYELVDLQINDIGFDDNMMKSMASVVASGNRKLATVNNSKADQLLVTRRADAEGERTKILGLSRKEAEHQRGRGISGYAQKASAGLQEAMQKYSLNPELVLMVLAQDALREIATAGTGAVIDMQETVGGDANARKIMQLDVARRAAEAKPAAPEQK